MSGMRLNLLSEDDRSQVISSQKRMVEGHETGKDDAVDV